MFKATGVMLALLMTGVGFAEPMETINEKEAAVYAEEAYILGYPLVMMEMARRAMTASGEAGVDKPTMGQLSHMRTLPDADTPQRPFSNLDLLYSIAWVDLKDEPYLLKIPKIEGRLFLFPLIGAWNEEFFAIAGVGGEGGQFLITGPEWHGKLPEGVVEVKSPTNLVFIPGRLFTSGTEEDLKHVRALQDQIELKPLSHIGEAPLPSVDIVYSPQEMADAVAGVEKMKADEYFKILAGLLQSNPPVREKNTYLSRFKRIGIVPGKDYTTPPFKTRIIAAIEGAKKTAFDKIAARSHETEAWDNTWTYTLSTGSFGDDYLQRAHMAKVGLGANLPRESIYLITDQDQLRRKLTGKDTYILHFSKERLPPVKGMWSITVYDEQGKLVRNKINRHSYSSKDDIRYNFDGSLDLILSQRYPGTDKEGNWLPVPEGKFFVMLRLYLPQKQVLENSWHPPAVASSQ
ncbi:DUF1254 domain-containing protein [Estrella lausannensis]|uniref:Uncharacterized protein n=1 Tax=Estrella lausannensis TaxID=483423 RepID=A0A0H5DPM2_9BACT|nr:DUF1254 domain-containing protein [Estrella lausannensis]CRX38521.1 hypothetical protein ELAC_1179 [Estrella lausannensis]